MNNPIQPEYALAKIEVLALAAEYLSETEERSLHNELIERIEVTARKALETVQGVQNA